MKLYHLGMDVHSKETVFVAGTDDGVVLLRGKVDTTPTGMCS